ncbi:zinc transporter [Litoreibacter ascidiaceicola]|uniref:Zinc transporter n=1 Tax=Litoreibacter ascidiaceicola TaxID=1486859 RepID=A0A1M5BWT9_9RHOB|nr:zinc transporter ZntB [Litoreibacter ascidiaceicola]SHF46959.1 zinc transporter [Litoreibacter ascidiaceicola]
MTFQWHHFELGDPKLPDWLSANVPDIAASALTQSETRPRCDRLGDGVILNLRGVNLNEGQDVEDMVSLRLWVTSDMIVTVRMRRIFALEDIRKQIAEGIGPETVGEFLTLLVTGLTDRIENTALRLTSATDDMEDAVLEGGREDLAGLGPLRHTTIKLRRYIGPQKDALVKLAALDSPVLTEADKLQLREPANRMALALEALDAVRDRLLGLQDHLDIQASLSQGRNGYVLSLIAGVFLPLGFLTGLFGMNVAGLPGTEWPMSFALLCIAMVAVAAALVAVFKWLDWL